MSVGSMIKWFDFSRSPVTAAAGSGVLIVAALVGVIMAAGSAAAPSNAASAQYTAAPLNQAPLVLPKPCVVTKNHQACDARAAKPHRAKQVTKQPAQPTALPVATVAPNPISP
jgi:hypothetical protein